MKFDVNTEAVVNFSKTMEKLSKTAMPKAVRYTINSAAFDVKTNSMPVQATKKFEKRSPNFFKANSRVEKSTSLDLAKMKATVGFMAQNLQGSNNYAVKDLEQQEKGGRIAGRSFVPLDSARQGNNYTKSVRSQNRISTIKNIVNAQDLQGRNFAQKFVKAAIIAGPGGFVLSKNILFRINSGKTNLKSKATKLKTTALYIFKKGGKVKVRKTDFMKKASMASAAKMESFFVEEAKKQIERLKK